MSNHFTALTQVTQAQHQFTKMLQRYKDIILNCKLNICTKKFKSKEESKSSTWREVEAIRYSLDSMKNSLKNNHPDNYNKIQTTMHLAL